MRVYVCVCGCVCYVLQQPAATVAFKNVLPSP